jgi:hypothetical protein
MKLLELWKGMVDTLSSRGAAILILFVLFVGLLILRLHIAHHGDSPESARIADAQLTGVGGALLMALDIGRKNGDGAKAGDVQ